MPEEPPQDALDRAGAAAEALESLGTATVRRGPMNEGRETEVEVPPVASVETETRTDGTLGEVVVVSVELNIEPDEYWRALSLESVSYADAVYDVLAEHDIRRPEDTPTLGVQVNKDTTGTVVVEGVVD